LASSGDEQPFKASVAIAVEVAVRGFSVRQNHRISRPGDWQIILPDQFDFEPIGDGLALRRAGLDGDSRRIGTELRRRGCRRMSVALGELVQGIELRGGVLAVSLKAGKNLAGKIGWSAGQSTGRGGEAGEMLLADEPGPAGKNKRLRKSSIQVSQRFGGEYGLQVGLQFTVKTRLGLAAEGVVPGAR
jgi:hypothetical protein